MLLRTPLALLALLTVPAAAAPQDLAAPPAAPAEALVPLPSVFDFTGGQGWGVALGLGVEFESAYDGADEYELEVEPAGAVQWRWGDQMLFLEGFEAGWRARVAQDWLVQVNARWEGGREADDSDDGNLDGLEETDDVLVGVVEVRRGLGDDWRGWIGGRVMAGGSDFGTLGVLAGGYRFGQASDGTGSEAFVFTTFGDGDFLERDFGVTPAESAASGLPATDLDGGFRSVGLNLVHRRDLGRNWQLVGTAGVELYSSDVRKSPIAREDYEAELGLTLLFSL